MDAEFCRIRGSVQAGACCHRRKSLQLLRPPAADGCHNLCAQHLRPSCLITDHRSGCGKSQMVDLIGGDLQQVQTLATGADEAC